MKCSVCDSDVNVEKINLHLYGDVHECQLCADCRRMVINFIRDMKHVSIRARKYISTKPISVEKGTAFEASPTTED